MFRQLLTSLAFHTTFTLSSPPTYYTVTFHEAHPPLLAPFTSVSQICHIRDNECCVPFDVHIETYPPLPSVPNGRRPFFVHHAVISRDPGTNQTASSSLNVPIHPSHNFRIWDYPDEGCRGDSVEQLRQPGDRDGATTRGHGEDGISAIGLGNTSWAEGARDRDEDYHFPDAIFVEGVRYGSTEKPTYETGYKFVKDDRSERVDLPREVFGRPWFNVRWELLWVSRNASERTSRGMGGESSGLEETALLPVKRM